MTLTSGVQRNANPKTNGFSNCRLRLLFNRHSQCPSRRPETPRLRDAAIGQYRSRRELDGRRGNSGVNFCY